MAESSTNQPSILFVGGCHVYAFGIDPEAGFVPSTLRLLSEPGRRPKPETLAPVSPKQRQRIVDAVERLRPDVVVLQLGHWESMQPLPLPGCSRSSAERLKARVRAMVPRHLYWMVKSAYDRVSPRAHVDRRRIASQYASLFAALARLETSEVVVLEPFPTLDPVVRRYRRRVAGIIEEQVASYGFQMVRISPAFHRQGYPAVHPEYFQGDGLHLSEEGHAAVARVLAGTLAGSRVLNVHVHPAA